MSLVNYLALPSDTAVLVGCGDSIDILPVVETFQLIINIMTLLAQNN